MKQDTNPTAYKKIRQAYYVQVAKRENKEKQMMIVVALVTLLFTAILFFTAALAETSIGKCTYIYGEREQKISKDQAIVNKVQLIDMIALAEYCNFEKESRASQIEFKINGTNAVFYNESDTAYVNGIEIKMPTKATIKNGYCLIPLSTAEELLEGVIIDIKGKTINVALEDKKVYMIVEQPKIEYATDISDSLKYINSNDEYIFTLVNKTNPVTEDFPTDKDSLIEIPAKYRKEQVIYLYNVALGALEAMMEDMFASGIDDIYVTSAYRNHNYQTMLFEMYIENEMQNGYTYEQAVERANKYSARPEHSEHRTGLCVDFTTRGIYGVVDDAFEGTEAFEWLIQNSWKYGFVLRYPEDKTDITGYQYESWHYRFVGLEKASIMYQTGLCYEEYLATFENK